MNIYGRNDYSGRIKQLRKHNEILTSTVNYIYCGDFNCIENFELDCIGKVRKQFDSRKSDREVLRNLETQNGYVDTYRQLNPTWLHIHGPRYLQSSPR